MRPGTAPGGRHGFIALSDIEGNEEIGNSSHAELKRLLVELRAAGEVATRPAPPARAPIRWL